MMQHMADCVEHIYLALGYTDFRRQITGLTAMVALQFKMDPYSGNILFLFCNKRHTAIKALRLFRCRNNLNYYDKILIPMFCQRAI